MQALPPAVPSWLPARTLLVLASIGLAALVLGNLVDRDARPLDALRRRFVLGVPWGTVVTIAVVLAVYLFLQTGWERFGDPLVLPFRSWSYLYPLGMATAAFAHNGPGHLIGNLLGTAVYGSAAEYAWGHFPRERGAETFTSLRTNPYARALAVPAACLLVGLFTALFALGPIVGFSGVVFALAGFAIVTRPVGALGALLAGRVLDLWVSAVRFPRTVSVARPRVSTPWWADIAIQGHAIGLLVGAFLGAALLSRRAERPRAERVWFAALVFATAQGLWAVYVPRGGGRFVLFRWAGAALIVILATLIALALSDGLPRVSPSSDRRERLRLAAGAVLLVALAGLSAAAVPYNVAPVGQDGGPQPAVEVRGYEVSYATNVPNEYIGAVSIPFVEDPTEVNTSAVIVVNRDRYIWRPAVLSQELATRGHARVLVGGVGWRRSVYVDRVGWNPVGNASVYSVYLKPDGGNWSLVYTADPRRIGPTLGGRNVTLRATEGGFKLDVYRNDTRLATAPIPENGSQISAANITFRRNRRDLLALYDGTRLTIATREQDR